MKFQFLMIKKLKKYNSIIPNYQIIIIILTMSYSSNPASGIFTNSIVSELQIIVAMNSIADVSQNKRYLEIVDTTIEMLIESSTIQSYNAESLVQHFISDPTSFIQFYLGIHHKYDRQIVFCDEEYENCDEDYECDEDHDNTCYESDATYGGYDSYS